MEFPRRIGLSLPSPSQNGKAIGEMEMHSTTLFRVAAGLSALISAGIGSAQTLPFNGTITGIGSGRPDSSCAPATARGILDPSSSSGSSTIGTFTYGHNWCFYGPSGPIAGTFDLFFGPDTVHGTLSGLASPSGTPGLTNLDLAYTILSGTGAFSGATGNFGGIATADVRSRSPTAPLFTLNFTGGINAPALPEPATWAMMLIGFGAIGIVLRRSKGLLVSARGGTTA